MNYGNYAIQSQNTSSMNKIKNILHNINIDIKI